MYKSNLKIFLVFLSISLAICFTGCCRDYTDSLNSYNTTINEAAANLTVYYDSMYKLNRELYFDRRREPLPDVTKILKKLEISYKSNQDDYYRYFIDLGKDLSNAELNGTVENPLYVTPKNLEDLKKSINGLALYSKDLVLLYSDKLPDITQSTINSMVSDLKNVSTTAGYNDYGITSMAAGAGNVLAELAKVILQEKKNNYVKLFVNRSSCTINGYLSALSDANEDIQIGAKSAILRCLVDKDIPYYNDSVKYLILHPKDSSAEVLRLHRLDNIEEKYNLYIALQNSDPKPLIKKMKKAQCELVNYVNGYTKDPKELLNTLKEIKTILSLINAAMP